MTHLGMAAIQTFHGGDVVGKTRGYLSACGDFSIMGFSLDGGTKKNKSPSWEKKLIGIDVSALIEMSRNVGYVTAAEFGGFFDGYSHGM